MLNANLSKPFAWDPLPSDRAVVEEFLKYAWNPPGAESFTTTLSLAGETISEGQGCSALRMKVIQLLDKSEHFLLLSTLNGVGQFNHPLSNLLKFKLLAHEFNLKGRVSISPISSVSLVGWHETFALPILKSLFGLFSNQASLDDQQPTCNEIKTVLKEALWGDNLTDQRLKEGVQKIVDPNGTKPLLVASGYDWHATYIIFIGSCFIYCNCGNDYIESGFSIYEIGSKEAVSVEWLRHLAERLKVTKSQYQTECKLSEDLQASLMHAHPMKLQKVGNCTYKNLKVALFALISLAKATQNFTTSFLPSEHDLLKNSIELARPMYKSFVSYSKEFVFNRFLQDLKEVSETCDMNVEEPSSLENHTSMTAIAQILNEKLVAKVNSSRNQKHSNSVCSVWEHFESSLKATECMKRLIAKKKKDLLEKFDSSQVVETLSMVFQGVEWLMHDKDFVFACVQQNGLVLHFASADLKNNKTIVLAAVAKRGVALCYASEDLKNDKEVVLAAVKQYGYALLYANVRLRGDKEIVLAALNYKGKGVFDSEIFSLASDELKNDKEVVLAAVRRHASALQLVSEALRNDPEVLSAVQKM